MDDNISNSISNSTSSIAGDGLNVVYVKQYSSVSPLINAVNEKEIWRYAGYIGGPNIEETALKACYEETLKEALPILNYKVCFCRMEHKPEWAVSENLDYCLKNSQEVVLFCATVGLELDRKIAKYQHISPVKALLLQAFGAERIEALCDAFCKEDADRVKEKGLELTPRFSPGYGDLALEVQRDWFALLDCSRKIGVSLNESCLMTPSKSVTAIYGIRAANSERSGYY